MKRKASNTDIEENRNKITKILDSFDENEKLLFSKYTTENYNDILLFYELEKINGDRYINMSKENTSKYFYCIKWVKSYFKSETLFNFQSYLESNADSAIIHFKKQIEKFTKSKYNKSLDDYDVDICNTLSESLSLPGFLGKGQVDAMIVPKWYKSYLKNCFVSIKFVKEYNNESNVKGQALAQLLSVSIKSKYPILHVITDFKKFQLSYIYYCDIDKTYYLCESIADTEKALSIIIFWLDEIYSNTLELENSPRRRSARNKKETDKIVSPVSNETTGKTLIMKYDGLVRAKSNFIKIATKKANYQS